MSREKQIEELTKILLTDCEGACTDCEYYERYDGSVCIPMRLANVLYNAGYRKQINAVWVERRCEFTDGSQMVEDYYCSNCFHEEGDNDKQFCPNCGAHMKGANDEN